MRKEQTENIIRINELIEKFFKRLGYGELEAFYADEFAFYPLTEEISYTLCDNVWSDLGFSKYVRKNFPKCPECSLFTISLLHEVGHYVTKDTLNRKKFKESRARKKAIEKIKVNSVSKAIKVQLYYCSLYDERIATAAAVKILKKNYKLVLDFEYALRKVVKDAGALL